MTQGRLKITLFSVVFREGIECLTFAVYFLHADVEQAVGAFEELEKMDPFRLENMDIYSNLLYVKVSSLHGCYSASAGPK